MQFAYLGGMSTSATHKKTFSITDKQLAFIQSQTQSGEYASASEVVRAGLYALEREKALQDASFIESVRETVRKIDSGEMQTYPAEEVFARAKAKLIAKAQGHEHRNAG